MKIHQHEAKIFNKMYSFEASIGLLPSFQLSHQKNPFYSSLIKIHLHGAEIVKKYAVLKLA